MGGIQYADDNVTVTKVEALIFNYVTVNTDDAYGWETALIDKVLAQEKGT